ncbi:hypothetical protein Peur_015105 [Populus x canadensis]
MEEEEEEGTCDKGGEFGKAYPTAPRVVYSIELHSVGEMDWRDMIFPVVGGVAEVAMSLALLKVETSDLFVIIAAGIQCFLASVDTGDQAAKIFRQGAVISRCRLLLEFEFELILGSKHLPVGAILAIGFLHEFFRQQPKRLITFVSAYMPEAVVLPASSPIIEPELQIESYHP